MKIMKDVERWCMPFFLVLWYLCLVRHQRRLDERAEVSGQCWLRQSQTFNTQASFCLESSKKIWQRLSVQYSIMMRVLAVFLWRYCPWCCLLNLVTDAQEPLSLKSHALSARLPEYKGIKCILQIKGCFVLFFGDPIKFKRRITNDMKPVASGIFSRLQ